MVIITDAVSNTDAIDNCTTIRTRLKPLITLSLHTLYHCYLNCLSSAFLSISTNANALNKTLSTKMIATAGNYSGAINTNGINHWHTVTGNKR